MVGLHEREETITQQIQARSSAKLEESDILRSQAVREDERLTNVSIPQAMLPRAAPLLDPDQARLIWHEKREKVAGHQAKLDEMNSYALHSLYMNARKFITTEEQLLAAIEMEFLPPGQNEKFMAGEYGAKGENIWKRGVPSRMKDLLSQSSVRAAKNGQQPGDGEAKARFLRDQERMKRIAEELSGGKI